MVSSSCSVRVSVKVGQQDMSLVYNKSAVYHKDGESLFTKYAVQTNGDIVPHVQSTETGIAKLRVGLEPRAKVPPCLSSRGEVAIQLGSL